MLTLSANTDAELIRQAKELLEARGFLVTQWYKWKTPRKLCARLGINLATLHRRLAKLHRPSVELIKSKATGRLLQVASNAAFDRFLTEGKR